MSEATPSDGKSTLFRWFTGGVIVLMIVLMIFTGTTSRQARMSHGVLVGTSNSGDVMSQDTQYATRLLDQLSMVYVVVPGGSQGERPQIEPLLGACWSESVYRDLKAHPEALFLALREARRVAPGVSPLAIGPIDPEQQQPDNIGVFNSGRIEIDDLHPLARSLLGNYRSQIGQSFPVELRYVQHTEARTVQVSPNSLPPLEQQNLYAALYDFLTLQSAASLPTNAIKATSPIVDRMLAQRFQFFSLDLAAIDAKALLSKVPEPTQQQLQEHLAKYAAFIPGRLSLDNPFGYGYRVPDRVKLELISVKRADIRNVVQEEKTPYEWEVAARIAFQKDPSLVPTSQPATMPTTAPARTFEAVKDQAVAAAIDRATDARQAEIEKAIRAPMMVDYQQWSNATTTRPGATTLPAGSVPKSSLDVPYNAPDYLQKLAQVVERKYKVHPTVVLYTDRYRDAVGLSQIAGFNEATRVLPPDVARRLGRESMVITGPEYALRLAKDLLDPQRIELFGSMVLERYRPSERVEFRRDNGGDGEVFFFRIADAEKNHPGTELEPIREKVASDWRAAEAQKLAMAQATAAADAAKSNPDFSSAVTQTIGSAVFHADVGPFHSSPPGDNPLGVSLPAYVQFGTQVTDKLTGEATIAALDVPLAAKAYAAKRLSMHGEWANQEELQMLRSGLRARFAMQMLQPRDESNPFGVAESDVAQTWLDAKSILARHAYKPAHEEKE